VIDCSFATYARLPGLDPDDLLVVQALRERGVGAQAGVWTDPDVDWGAARLCVIRSTWDYPQRYVEFERWLNRVEAVTAVRNPPDLVRWNAHKSYLRDLEAAGVPIVPTAWVVRGSAARLDEIAQQRGWTELIVKPAYGAATLDVLRVGLADDERAGGQRHLERLIGTGDALVQPFLTSVASYPERALVFIGGVYSHAVSKQPFQALRPAGEAGEAPVVATADEIVIATRAMRVVPGRTLYARVDLIRDEANAARVLELEVIEPSLFLGMHPPAVAAFADAIIAELAAL